MSVTFFKNGVFMLEKEIERVLVKEVKKLGGLCLKFNSLSMTGIPDRIILMKNARLAFVELKRKGKKLRPLQKKRIKQLRDLGFKCFIIDDLAGVKTLTDEMRGESHEIHSP